MMVHCKTPRSRRSRLSIKREKERRKKDDQELLAAVDKEIQKWDRRLKKWK
jgi:hypothetical protein|tara:strand:+ start:2538 stop:2690 length:153 start_codon:yes stop_codon:yes gene_type:complete